MSYMDDLLMLLLEIILHRGLIMIDIFTKELSINDVEVLKGRVSKGFEMILLRH